MTSVKHGALISFCLAWLVAAPAVAQAPGGWPAVERKGLQLIVDGKADEAVALLQKFVAANPGFGEAHGMLATAHSAAAEALEGAGPAAAASRTRHLQNAARHYGRTIELTRVNRLLNVLSLAETYGPGGLNQPADAEKYARLLVEEGSSGLTGPSLLSWALAEMGRSSDAVLMLRRAREKATMKDQLKLGVALTELAKQPAASAAAARVLLVEALAIADAAIKEQPSYGQAYMFKSLVIERQAAREQDPARKAALTAEGAALWDKGREVNGAGRATASDSAQLPVPPPPPPPPPLPDSAEGRHKLGVDLYDRVYRDPSIPPAEGRTMILQAVAAFDRALQSKPDYREALVFKSLALRLQAAKFEPDPERAKALVAEADRLRARAVELMKRKL